ncbi:AAA family ATPase [Methanococcus maripaludis]|uniref:AAA+ ATPase domain-containing protein n=2 Tax=Methanococcus maripaludis TaxID=39152 RepID=A0A7J9PJS7_METMI|nr:AAA family ATPase [Methanococcus maripaludis]MBA2862917.1 hypothetical protein [Methanococcus maripaludis]
MNKLYVYDIDSLETLKKELNEYKIITLSSIIVEAPMIEDIEDLELQNNAVDITNVFYDTFYSNKYGKSLLERYILELNDNFPEIVYTIDSNEKNNFLKVYPFLFEHDEIFECLTTNETKTTDVEELKTTLFNINTVYTYPNREGISKFKNFDNIFNFTQLIKDPNGSIFNIDFDKLSNYEEYYIDLTSLIDLLKIRKELIFSCESVFYKLSKKNNVKYLIREDLFDVLTEFFPFNFDKSQKFNGFDEDSVLTSSLDISCETIEKEAYSIINHVNENLQGHEDFKTDFGFNLLKFRYLNKIARRKILSIFLCGKSGVGKTEFARIISQKMYPNCEQIKLNFGNYSTEGVLNSLIGSPLGYRGSERGGELINKIKVSESKVILIDEFEKADETVFNFFYELLEDGKFTDRAGIEHDLNGYIIIFTSNLDKNNYSTVIPEALRSRFDMKYFFNPLKAEDKSRYVEKYSVELIEELENVLGITFNKDNIITKLKDLIHEDNMREIRRKIEDIVLSEMNIKSN